jgi:hypothetical protein
MTIQAIPLPNTPDNTNPINSNTSAVSGQATYAVSGYNPNGEYIFSASSSATPSSQPFNAFDGNETTYWQCDYFGNPGGKYTQGPYYHSYKYSPYIGGGDDQFRVTYTNYRDTEGAEIGVSGEWVQVKFPNPLYIYKYEMEFAADSCIPQRYVLLGSHDGYSWEYIHHNFLTFPSQKEKHVIATATNSRILTAEINNIHKYTHYRFVVTEIRGQSPYLKIKNFKIVGDPTLGLNPLAETFTNLSRSIETFRCRPSDVSRGNVANATETDFVSEPPQIAETAGFVAITIIISLSILYVTSAIK